MARWKLVNAHYLPVPGTEWEYKEMDRNTGREKRMRIAVPQLLNPNDPGDWNYRWGNKDNEDGEIIVCHEGKGEPKDIVFTAPDNKSPGNPTPDMVPLDDEAKAISASFADKWKHPVDAPAGSFSQSLIDGMQDQMVKLQNKPAQVEGMQELLAIIGASMKQNAEILSAVTNPARRL